MMLYWRNVYRNGDGTLNRGMAHRARWIAKQATNPCAPDYVGLELCARSTPRTPHVIICFYPAKGVTL